MFSTAVFFLVWFYLLFCLDKANYVPIIFKHVLITKLSSKQSTLECVLESWSIAAVCKLPGDKLMYDPGYTEKDEGQR